MTEDEMVGWHHNSMAMNLSRLQETVEDREAWRAATHGVAEIWTRPSDCTIAMYVCVQHTHFAAHLELTQHWKSSKCQSKLLFKEWAKDLRGISPKKRRGWHIGK